MNETPNPKPKTESFFLEERLPLYIDKNLARELAEHLDRHPSDNPAITALMKKLKHATR